MEEPKYTPSSKVQAGKHISETAKTRTKNRTTAEPADIDILHFFFTANKYFEHFFTPCYFLPNIFNTHHGDYQS